MNSVQAQTDSPDICPDRQLLILDAVRPELLPQAVREQLFEHLCGCWDCAKLYDEICAVHRDLAVPSTDLGSDIALQAAEFMTQEEGLQDVWQRIAAGEAQEMRDQRHQVIYRIGKVSAAMAACLLLAVGLFCWWSRSNSHATNSAVAMSASPSLPRTTVGLLPSTGPLGDNISALLPEAAPFDPAKVDCVTWREDHKEWFASTFPWIFQAQKVLQAKGINAGYVELLMVSGDRWQFHYDPQQSSRQPLTKLDPSAIICLARHYAVDERELLRAAGLPNSARVATLPAQSTPAQEYADALRRWHDALVNERPDKSQANGNLMLFSLPASTYLAKTRTAAYLWAKVHPLEAEQLLTDAGYRAMLPMPLATDGEDARLKQLREQAVAARSSAQVAMEWFLVPAGNGCISQATEHQRKLAALVAGLLSGLNQ